MICKECETVAHCTMHGCIPKQTALDKKAENARELGLDYEPVHEPSCKDCRIDKPCSAKGKDFDVCSLYVPPPAAPVVQEPVAWICNHYEEGVKNDVDYWQDDIDALPVGTPLYTTPPAAQRQWVGLMDEERNKLWRDVVKWGDPSHDDVDLIKAIEAKLKELNT